MSGAIHTFSDFVPGLTGEVDSKVPTVPGITEKTGTYTITTDDTAIECTSGTFNVQLPSAVGIAGQEFDVKNSGTGVITIVPDGSETIDGGAGAVLYQYNSITVKSNNTNWIIV